MKKHVKDSLLLLTLLMILILSISATFAQDLDDSTADLAVYNDDDSISIENQDIGYEEVSSANDNAGTDAVTSVDDDAYSEDTVSAANDEEILKTGEIVEPMPQVDTGVVSGGVDCVASNPASASGNIAYTVPEGMTNLKSAIVIVNVYSGSGASTYGLYSNVTLNTKNGLEELGYEALWLDKECANDPNVYAINDHATKQYSDYQMVYDITNKVNTLSSGDSITINVANSAYPDKLFDGRIKLISLFFAFDDGDNDKYTYWLNVGQLWTMDTESFNFNTQDYAGKTNNISLRTIALSSSLASSYKINNMEANYDSSSSGGLTYKDIKWDNIGPKFNAGANTNFWAQNGGGSYKTNVALLIASEKETEEPLTEVYVDYANGADSNLGTTLPTAFKTIEHALSVIEPNGIIYINGINYLDDVDVNGLAIDKNISIIGVGDGATIDANNNGRIFYITAETVSLSNLSLVNANVASASDKRGGALWVQGTTLTVDNCKFINNTAGASSSYGGAINLKSTSTTIKDSYFENNSAFYTGAGINAENSNLLLNVSNCIFTLNEILNTGWASGGAICSYNTVIIDKSAFYGNKLAEGKNGRTINQYGTGSLTITNSILLDGANSVYIASGPTVLENNWWGNNDTTAMTNPKDLDYTNANVGSYLYLNMTGFASGMEVGDTASININLVSTGDETINIMNLPATLTAVNGNIVPTETELVNGACTATYTLTTAGDNSITVHVLGIEDTLPLGSDDVISTEVVYVNATGGSDSNSGVSWNSAFQTIEKAISTVDDNGTIYVADGLYHLADSTSANGISITKNIAIIGESVNAVISGGNTKRIFTIGVGHTLNITNLTLTEGKSSAIGGAIQIEDGGNTNPITQGYLILTDSIISNCNANYGGAIGSNRAAVDNITNVTFINNHASSGGVIYVQQKSTLTIGENNKFINNSASGRASVLYAQATVTTGKNNLFYGNVATGTYGYGAICSYGFQIGAANVFVNNRATAGGALYIAGNRYSGSGSYVIFINNTDNNGRPVGKQSNSQSLTLNNCYWGTNEPNFSTLSNGGITASTYLVLSLSSDPSSIRVGDTTTITVDLTKNNNGATVDIGSLPTVLPLMFSVENGNVNPVETELVNGVGTTTYTPALMGEGTITANIYAPLETITLNVAPEAGTVFVNSTGGLDTNDGGSWDSAVKTLSHALDIVGEGKTIYMADGTYSLDGATVDGLAINKDLSIVGMGENVVIDANNNGRIFNIGTNTVELSNLAFINGNASTATDKRGGALYVNGANLIIDNCKFINNTAGNKEDAGGSSTYGGAINLKSSTTTITNSEFDGNTAWSTGAGINAENSNILLNISDSTFTNNVILNNGWSAGAAICSYNAVIINRSVFYGNKLTDETRNGKTINQYGTGSLTIENSILLDGEKGVWIATGPTTLENNWWGNNDANANNNPKDLGYTNADVESYFVLSSSINLENIYKGDSVTVTTTLNGNVIELPIVLSANAGTITPNETIIIDSEVSAYDATDLGDVEISIDVLGVKNVISFTVKEKLPDVAISNVKTQWDSGIYPAVNNTFTITLTNNEENAIEGLVLEVYSNETGELIASYTFESLASGATSISLTDPTIRPITEETVWPAAQDNKIKFTFNLMRGEDLVTTLSVDKILAYNGYLNKTYAYGGHDNIINRNYTISGDIIIATQDVSVYADQYTRFRNETWTKESIATPEDAEIVKVLLYFNYNWDTSYFPNGWELTFNDVDILNEYISYETDRGNLGGWGAYNYGVLAFDVTEYFKVNDNNSFVISKTGNCALYPSTLFILYNMTGSTTEKDIYFSDICDVYYPNYNMNGYDDLLKTVVYYNNINITDLASATWYAFAGSSSSNNNLTFNEGLISNPFSGYTSDDCRPYVYDVSGLIGNDNEAWFITGTSSSTTVAFEQVLVVERSCIIDTSITVANESVTLLVGDEFDIEAVLTPDVGELTYTSSDESVATVENGKIIAKVPGNAIITVSFVGNGNYAPSSATVTVSVKTEVAYVNYTGGSDTNDGSSWGSAVKTLSHALEIVGKGTIYIADGVHYLDGATADGLSINQNLSLIGVGDNVVLDANNNGRILNIGANTVKLFNLTFINGNASTATDKRGGALYVNGATLIIANCKFINNTAGSKEDAGGASTYGGAINLKSSSTTITNSEFDGNTAWSTAAGINAENSNILLNISDSTFTNNVILNNGWSAGAAICSYNAVIINRSVFYGNKLTDETRNGKTINQYGTGSLTIENSILLDGEKGVWIATGPTTLENNWWGNNDANANNNPKDLGYTNADVESYFVLSSTISKDTIYIGDVATVTTTLNGNVIELPIVLSVNAGTITPNETTITNSEESSYDATAVGDVEITIDVLGVENVISFTVNKKTADISVNVVPAQEYYPGIVTVIVQSNVDGVYNVGIGEDGIDVTVENGIGYETFYAIDAGKHNATVKFAGNEIYDEATVKKEFEIFKQLVPEFTVEFSDATYPEDVNVLINGPSGTYTVKVDDEHTIEINVGQDNIGTGSISGLAVGTYTDVNITFGGNDNVEAGSHLFTFTVKKSDEKENISDIIEINTAIPENSTDTVFRISLPENATGYLLVDIDGKHYYAPVENGTATVSVSGLAPGNYTATVTYSGDDEYASVTKETDVSVPSNVQDNALSIPETSSSSSPTYSINLPEDATGYLVVDVDGTKYVAALNKGSASVTVPGLSEGKHNVTVTYTGDGKYSGVSKSTTLNVHIPVYKITNNKNVAAIYSASASYKVRITKDGKAVGAGESVTITFNGKKTTVKTDKNGYATFKLNTKVKVKKYTITAEYKGVKVSNKVTIKHVIKASNKKVKKSKKVTKIKVSLKKVNGKYLKAKKLKIKFRGKTYKVKTNKKGVATWKVKKSILKKLKVGKKYKYKVTYGKDVVTKKLTIKK